MPAGRSIAVLALVAAALAACRGAAPAVAPRDGRAPDENPLVVARPYHFRVPAGYDPAKPAPLVIMLHGYSASGPLEDAYFRLGEIVDEHGFLYAYPDGTVDASGNRFWNATDACCDFGGIQVDDVAYVNAIIDDIESRYAVDPRRVFVTGHSNGGFMSHRLACDLAPRVAAIVSLAGAQWSDATRCVPTSPVAVLEVHGDADAVILYGGGQLFTHAYPSAPQTVADWALLEGCTGALVQFGTLDLDTSLPGAETTQQRYQGCPGPVDVELWTIHGGGHIPSFPVAPATPLWPEQIWAFFQAHPKP